MKRATAPLALEQVASPISPILIPAVPLHVDILGFALRRDTVVLYCENTTVFRETPNSNLHISTIVYANINSCTFTKNNDFY